MKSYFHQPGKFQFVYETIPERVKKLAEENPDKIAMIAYHSQEERYQITRKELFDKALRFAHVLIRLGIKKEDRVAYCVSNCIDWMVYDVGIMMAGAVSVHLLMGSADVKVTLSGCSMIILDAKERWDNFLRVAEIHPGGKVTCNGCSSLRLAMAVNPENRPTNALLASELIADIEDGEGRNVSQLPVLDPEDTAVINQTSGTTGYPKKVRHTHFNIINNFTNYCSFVGITSDDVCFIGRPMAYVAGYPVPYIGVGATVVTGDVGFLNDPTNNDIMVDIWRKEGGNVIQMPPQRLKSLRDYGFRVKLIISGGDMITKDMIQQSFVFTDAFTLLYASTETILTALEIFTRDNVSKHQQGMLGHPFAGVEVKITNGKEIVDMGIVGTLCIRSAWNTDGYDGSAVSPIDNGWFQSNDLCLMQPNGNLLMKGRKSGFIIKGTVNVSIALIEDYVGSHPDVKQVVVVGVPDPRYGEDICACVQVASISAFDSSDLKAHCERKMSSKSSLDWIQMIPSYFLAFDEFPYLPTRKVDRNAIKNMAIQRLKENGLDSN